MSFCVEERLGREAFSDLQGLCGPSTGNLGPFLVPFPAAKDAFLKDVGVPILAGTLGNPWEPLGPILDQSVKTWKFDCLNMLANELLHDIC